MSAETTDRRFAGAIPAFYDRILVPLIFEPYADDLVARLLPLAPARVLEIAAGTGVVTRRLARALPATTAIVATDLNPAMLEVAQSVGTSRPVTWQQADAQSLPFDDGSFDAVVCQFGAMFFPDRPHAWAETRRVLRPGGVLLFNVWDRIETNEFADVVTATLAQRYPADPPRFLARTPHGYHDAERIRADLIAGGFAPEAIAVHELEARSVADDPRVPAMAYCFGTPLRGEIEQRDPAGLEAAADLATTAIAARFGSGRVDGLIRALVCVVQR